MYVLHLRGGGGTSVDALHSEHGRGLALWRWAEMTRARRPEKDTRTYVHTCREYVCYLMYLSMYLSSYSTTWVPGGRPTRAPGFDAGKARFPASSADSRSADSSASGGRRKQNRTKQDKTGQNRTKQNKTKRCVRHQGGWAARYMHRYIHRSSGSLVTDRPGWARRRIICTGMYRRRSRGLFSCYISTHIIIHTHMLTYTCACCSRRISLG